MHQRPIGWSAVRTLRRPSYTCLVFLGTVPACWCASFQARALPRYLSERDLSIHFPFFLSSQRPNPSSLYIISLHKNMYKMTILSISEEIRAATYEKNFRWICESNSFSPFANTDGIHRKKKVFIQKLKLANLVGFRCSKIMTMAEMTGTVEWI
jgi:hypothetical protein